MKNEVLIFLIIQILSKHRVQGFAGEPIYDIIKPSTNLTKTQKTLTNRYD